MSYNTYEQLMRAMKPDITETIIDAYWKTLDVPNKEDGLGKYYIGKTISFVFRRCRFEKVQRTFIKPEFRFAAT